MAGSDPEVASLHCSGEECSRPRGNCGAGSGARRVPENRDANSPTASLSLRRKATEPWLRLARAPWL